MVKDTLKKKPRSIKKDHLRSCYASLGDWAGGSGARAGVPMNYLTAQQVFMMGLHGRSPKPSPHGIRPVSSSGRPTCVLSPSASESPRTNPPYVFAADDVYHRGRRRRLPHLRRIRHARRPRQGPRGLLQGRALNPVPALLRPT